MKIITWNCNKKFREKYKLLEELNYDICVIQECENPKTSKNLEYKEFFNNSIWIGENKNMGLGVFAKPHIELKENNWDTYCLRHFLSCRVNNLFDLVGVWAGKPYIEEYYIYQCINKHRYINDTIIIGDFNSNVIWDKEHRNRNHSMVNLELEKIGLKSSYHNFYKEDLGKEKIPTFYHYKYKENPYHIDYCYMNISKLKNMEIGNYEIWGKYSDHMPLIIDIET